MKAEELNAMAVEAMGHAYVPYSGFQVGAALLCADGSVYCGCNIENAAYTPSNCAERTAFFKAVSEGERAFRAIAIVGGAKGKPEYDFCAPCGVCRQVMMEFCILLANSKKEIRRYTLQELMPLGFGPDMLNE